MTLWLNHWLRILVPNAPRSARSGYPDIESIRLSDRDLADLNLPQAIAGRLAARQAAEELRRRVAW